jgi:hypothetical protein
MSIQRLQCKFAAFLCLYAASPPGQIVQVQRLVPNGRFKCTREQSSGFVARLWKHRLRFTNVNVYAHEGNTPQPVISIWMIAYILQVVDDLGDVPSSHSNVASQVQSKVRSEYWGYVRRLPPKAHCEVLFRYFFETINPLNVALDETIFRVQLATWWNLAHETLLHNGLEGLPDEFKCFPAILFQMFAIVLQFLPPSHDVSLEDLKFGPSQTFAELSEEYGDCGMALAKLIRREKATFTGVQYSFLRDWWYVNTGELTRAWNHSRQTIKYSFIHLCQSTLAKCSFTEMLLQSACTLSLQRQRLISRKSFWVPSG